MYSHLQARDFPPPDIDVAGILFSKRPTDDARIDARLPVAAAPALTKYVTFILGLTSQCLCLPSILSRPTM